MQSGFLNAFILLEAHDTYRTTMMLQYLHEADPGKEDPDGVVAATRFLAFLDDTSCFGPVQHDLILCNRFTLLFAQGYRLV